MFRIEISKDGFDYLLSIGTLLTGLAGILMAIVVSKTNSRNLLQNRVLSDRQFRGNIHLEWENQFRLVLSRLIYCIFFCEGIIGNKENAYEKMTDTDRKEFNDSDKTHGNEMGARANELTLLINPGNEQENELSNIAHEIIASILNARARQFAGENLTPSELANLKHNMLLGVTNMQILARGIMNGRTNEIFGIT